MKNNLPGNKAELIKNSIYFSFRLPFYGKCYNEVKEFCIPKKAWSASLLVLLFLIASLDISYGQTTFTSATTGNWKDGSTWIGGVVPGATDHAVISGGHTVSLTNSATIANLTINTEGVLNADNQPLRVNGNLIINGTYTSKSSAAKDLDFYGSLIGGMGNIIIDFAGNYLIINNNATIESSCRLLIYANIILREGVTLTNQGQVEITRNIEGTNATTSVWTNSTNSKLIIGDQLLSAADPGILNATASGNTIEYNKLGDQEIKNPSSATYNNLVIRGSGNKNLRAHSTVLGNIEINNSASFVSNNFNIDLKGNWTNMASFTEGTGNVLFTGPTTQSVSSSGDETFHGLTVNKPSGELSLNSNVIVSNSLTLQSGIINTNLLKITLGISTVQTGSLAYTGGFVKGKFERWVNTTGTIDFPIGYTNAQRCLLTFNGIVSGGSLMMEFVQSDPGNNGLTYDDAGTLIYNTFVEGYWTLSKHNGFNLGGANSFDLQLDGTGFSSFPIDGTTRILYRPDPGSNWSTDGVHQAPFVSIVKRTGLSNLPAQYALGDDTNCLKPLTSVISGSADVCLSQSGSVYSVVDNPPNTYTWTINGGIQVGGGNSNSITVNWGALGIENGSVSVVEKNTCTSGAPKSLPVRIHSIPTASISGKSIVAENSPGVAYSVPLRAGYMYNWVIIGGTQASGGNSNSITVNWGTLGTGSVSVVAWLPGCLQSTPVILDILIYDVIESIATGDWSDATTWNCGCVPFPTQSVRIRSGHTVTLDAPDLEITNFHIDLGGTLFSDGKEFYVHGETSINGTYNGTSAKKLYLDGIDKPLEGIGTINGGFSIPIGNKTISSTSVLSVNSGPVILGSSVFVTNNGRFVLSNDLVGADASSTWSNSDNSGLDVSGILLATGTLRADAPGNTVNYYGPGLQTIKVPFNSTYHDLTSSGSGTKNLAGPIQVDGDLTIEDSSIFDVFVAGNTINLRGNWIKAGTSTFNPRTGLVTFDGSTPQSITGSETFNNLTFANSSQDLTLNSNVIVGNVLTMAGRNIVTGANTLTIGTDAVNIGSLSYTSGILIGKIKRWIKSFGNVLYPVGKSGSYNPANIYINVLATSGTVTGEFIPSDPGSSGLPFADGTETVVNQFTEGYWNFTAANGFATSDYNLNLNGTNFTSNNININTRILKRTNGGSWIFPVDGTHASAVPPIVYRNSLTGGISTLSTQFCLGFVCAPATITGFVTNATCFGAANGAININITGGTAPFTYLWTPGGVTTEDISGLTAQSYLVTATDSRGCITPVAFNVSQPAQLVISEAVTNINCGNASSGAINITASGGTAPYSYLWSTVGGTGLVPANEDQTGLTAGTYTVLVFDPNGCNVTKNIIVSPAAGPPPAPTASVTAQPTCAVSTGTILVTAPLGAYEYSKDGVVYQPGATFSGLASGNYSITVRSTTDITCVSPAISLTVNAVPIPPAAPIASVTVQPTCTLPTGTIVVTSPLGMGWEYRLDAGTFQSSDTFTSVDPGIHNVFVRTTSDITCVSSPRSLTVDPVPSPPVVNSIVGAAFVCEGETLVPYGVTVDNTGTATYSWSYSGLNATLSSGTGSSITIDFADNATSGNLSLVETITATGCSTVNVKVITVNPLPEAITGILNICIGSSTALSNATPGGTWSSATPGIATIDGAGNVTGIAEGTSVISYTMPSGCEVTAIITVNAVMTVTAGSSTPTLCVNTALTDITHTTTFATGIGVSSGLPTGVTASFAVNTITINGTPTTSGTFNYSIPLTGGCGAIDATGTIIVSALPSSPVAGVNTYTYDGTLKTASATVGGGEVVDWYAAATGGTTIAAPSGTNVGTYSAFAEARNITTGCVSSSRTPVTLTINNASLTIDANDLSKVYGTAYTFLGTEFTTTGLTGSDAVTSVTLTSLGAPATASVAGSPYVITPSAAVGSGLANYTITYNNGTLTVDPATLTITAENKNKL